MLLSVVTVAVAQFLDFGTFAVMVGRHGLAAEGNPLVAVMVHHFGMPGAALAKVALVGLVAASVLVLRANRNRPAFHRLAAGILGMAILAGIVGGWTNAQVIGSIWG